MKYALLLLALVSCAESFPAGRDFPVSRPHGRSALFSLGQGIVDAADQCTFIGRTDFAFADWCVNVLIPAKDALVLANESSKRWSTDAEGKTACAGLATTTALRRLEDGFRARRVKPTTYEEDAIVLGDELSATAKCDPLHPGVFVTVIRPTLPANFADYP